MTRKYTVYVLRSGGASTPLNNKPCLFSLVSAASPPPVPRFLRPAPRFFVIHHTLRMKEAREFFALCPAPEKEKKEASRAPPAIAN